MISENDVDADEPTNKKARQDKETDEDEIKVFNDPIHGHIELHPLMVRIIDTPQFQRLRHIKQIGGGYWVFPGASHNRFEHSIGVGHLAGELVETLQRKQPELGIDDKDVLCVKIAGLCHDLGHGPFSHVFDGRFIPKFIATQYEGNQGKWKGSEMMIDHLIEVNNLRPEFKKHGLHENDIIFIKEQIAGIPEPEMCDQQSSDWAYRGRPKEKSFLYEIVANKLTGVDVDKWDYFSRDCHGLGISCSFDMRRYMKFARVIEVDGKRHICTRDKERVNLYEMFHTRNLLHKRAIQHKTKIAVENMIAEALLGANDHLKLPDKDGNLSVKMSEAIHNPYAYTCLTDHVFHHILLSPEPELEESRKLLKRIENRELYKFIGQISCDDLTSKDEISPEAIASAELTSTIEAKDILIDEVKFDYGMEDQDPVGRVWFYEKHTPNKASRITKDQAPEMLPEKFSQRLIMVFCRKSDRESFDAAKRCFDAWCKVNGFKNVWNILCSLNVTTIKIMQSPYIWRSRSKEHHQLTPAKKDLSGQFKRAEEMSRK